MLRNIGRGGWQKEREWKGKGMVGQERDPNSKGPTGSSILFFRSHLILTLTWVSPFSLPVTISLWFSFLLGLILHFGSLSLPFLHPLFRLLCSHWCRNISILFTSPFMSHPPPPPPPSTREYPLPLSWFTHCISSSCDSFLHLILPPFSPSGHVSLFGSWDVS